MTSKSVKIALPDSASGKFIRYSLKTDNKWVSGIGRLVITPSTREQGLYLVSIRITIKPLTDVGDGYANVRIIELNQNQASLIQPAGDGEPYQYEIHET